MSGRHRLCVTTASLSLSLAEHEQATFCRLIALGGPGQSPLFLLHSSQVHSSASIPFLCLFSRVLHARRLALSPQASQAGAWVLGGVQVSHCSARRVVQSWSGPFYNPLCERTSLKCVLPPAPRPSLEPPPTYPLPQCGTRALHFLQFSGWASDLSPKRGRQALDHQLHVCIHPPFRNEPLYAGVDALVPPEGFERGDKALQIVMRGSKVHMLGGGGA